MKPRRKILDRRFWVLSISGLLFWMAVSHFWVLGMNRSESLPYHLVAIHKGEMPERGELVAFYPGATSFYPAGVWFVKYLSGTPGDRVTRRGNVVYVNDREVARLKPAAKNGMPLFPGPTGVIPEGHYFVSTPHPDGFDSRYAEIGFVPQEKIIGKAYVLIN